MARRTGFELVFYQDAAERQPVRDWLRNDLSPEERRTVGAAMRHLLQEQGMGVCGTAFGRQLGGGLFEFRLRESNLLLRVFCHAYGDKVILLIAAYDKSEDPSAIRQQKEIELARRRLTDGQ